MPPFLTTQLEKIKNRLSALKKSFKGSPVSIGLDIGSASVKGVKLTQTPQGLQLTQMATASIPLNADLGQRTQTIQQVIQGLPGRETRIITAVGGSGAVLRSVTLPRMSAKELKSSLRFEAEKYIPFKLDDTVLDVAILGERPPGRMEVLLAAAKTELINAHLTLLTAAGIVPYAIDLEAMALANAWEVSHTGENPEGVVSILHVGARGTILDFIRGLQLQFTREIPIGGIAFTQAVVEKLELDVVEAEAIKCEPQSRQNEVQAALVPVWEDWFTQCRASFDFYESQFGQRVERLLLSGGSVRLPNFPKWVQEAAGVPTEVWDPLQGISLSSDSKQLESQRVDLGVAVGLAVREVVG